MKQFFDKPFADMPSVNAVGGGLLNKTKGDKYIWGIVVFLALTSLLVVYSATGSLAYKMYKGNTEVYLFKQFAFITIGIALIPVAILIAVAVASYDGHAEKDVKKSAAITELKSHGRIGTWIRRVQDFIYADAEQTPYQVQQSKIAIAKGGVFGAGPGNSQQRNFLPHPYSDFIYAIIIEEYGLVGGAVIIFIYLVFLLRCINIFKRCPFAFGAFLALGLSFTLVIQAMANMAVTVNLVPVTGVTLPLVSMGGSSFLFTCASIGIILSVARNVQQIEGKDQSPLPATDQVNVG